jgi:hypothetical protein
MNWLDGGDLPKTIVDSYFNPMRLLMLQTRRSAAYFLPAIGLIWTIA